MRKRTTGSAAARLRRLRLILTMLLTGINAAGLIVFAALAIANNARTESIRLDGDLSRVVSTVNRLLQYDHTLITDFVPLDEINKECPQFAVLPSAEGNFPAYYSASTCVPVDRAQLGGLANEAAHEGHSITGYINGPTGELLRVDVEPILAAQNRYIGAIVAVADAGQSQAEHDRFAWLMAGGAAAVIALLGAVCHLLSGRLVRPAETALHQQEILLAETAHDLRNPVASLRALAEVSLQNPEQMPEVMSRTLRLATRMGDVIDDLLDRARLAAGVAHLDKQPIWLDQLVTELVADTAADGVELTVNAMPTQVVADPKLVRRAVANLLDNAVKYGRLPGQPARIRVSVADGRVTIADRGPGIPAELATNLLDRFSTGAGSTGLGLSIVSWIASAHKGVLNVYNGQDGGAIFELVLGTP